MTLYEGETMGLREQWKFNYKVCDILEAANYKVDWHKGRHDWWVAKKKEVLDKIRQEGLEIDESVAADQFSSYKISNTGRQTQVLIRDDLMRDLNECSSKTEEHKNKIASYEAWVAVLSAQPENNMLELDQSDWLYFFNRK